MNFDAEQSHREYQEQQRDCARYRWLVAQPEWGETICRAIAEGGKAELDAAIDARIAAERQPLEYWLIDGFLAEGE